MERSFLVDSTLGFLRTEGPVFFLPPTGRAFALGWKLTRQARVVVTVETESGTVLRRLARRTFPAGEATVSWDGLGRDKKPVAGGRYVLRVVAKSELGKVEQTRPFRVRRVVR
jgi:flagellar hook assembly protein FlgD